jgi:membrane protein
MVSGTDRDVQRGGDKQPRLPRAPRERDKLPPAIPFWRLVRPGVGLKRFLTDLWGEIKKDELTDGAGVLAYFSMLAIFPAAILLLSLLPYLPIPNLEQSILASLYQAMPAPAAELFTSTVKSVVSERRGGLLSVGALATLWAASTGLQAVMKRINATYGVQETRSYLKIRGIAILLVLAVGTLVVSAFTLLFVGGIIHEYLARIIGENSLLLWVFLLMRWAVILLLMFSALSLLYYFGPNVKQHFRFITPGGALATGLFIASSLLFRLYVGNFGRYEATYGSLGAAVVLLLWLYVGGLVVLVGSEVNGLLEKYAKAREDQTLRK